MRFPPRPQNIKAAYGDPEKGIVVHHYLKELEVELHLAIHSLTMFLFWHTSRGALVVHGYVFILQKGTIQLR